MSCIVYALIILAVMLIVITVVLTVVDCNINKEKLGYLRRITEALETANRTNTSSTVPDAEDGTNIQNVIPDTGDEDQHQRNITDITHNIMSTGDTTQKIASAIPYPADAPPTQPILDLSIHKPPVATQEVGMPTGEPAEQGNHVSSDVDYATQLVKDYNDAVTKTDPLAYLESKYRIIAKCGVRVNQRNLLLNDLCPIDSFDEFENDVADGQLIVFFHPTERVCYIAPKPTALGRARTEKKRLGFYKLFDGVEERNKRLVQLASFAANSDGAVDFGNLIGRGVLG